MSGDVVRWGLIGCGDIARKRVAPALRSSSNSELVAVSRARADLAASFATEFGARKWYSDWHELIVDPEISAVYIATPVHLHSIQTIESAASGKHVLVEKPMALTVEECDLMQEAAEKNRVRLGVAYYRHFYPVLAQIKNILASGEIGTVALVQMNAFEWFNPPADHPRHWLLEKKKSGGGPMFDFGCHRIEVLLNLFGPVAQIEAVQSNASLAREVEDTAVAVLRFSEGVCAVISVTHAALEPQDMLSIFGSEGSIHVPLLNAGVMTIKTAAGERTESHPPAANIHQPLIEDFVRSVLEDREPSVNGKVGREVARIEGEIYRCNGG